MSNLTILKQSGTSNVQCETLQMIGLLIRQNDNFRNVPYVEVPMGFLFFIVASYRMRP